MFKNREKLKLILYLFPLRSPWASIYKTFKNIKTKYMFVSFLTEKSKILGYVKVKKKMKGHTKCF